MESRAKLFSSIDRSKKIQSFYNHQGKGQYSKKGYAFPKLILWYYRLIGVTFYGITLNKQNKYVSDRKLRYYGHFMTIIYALGGIATVYFKAVDEYRRELYDSGLHIIAFTTLFILTLDVKNFEELAKKFDRPVIGLNWTKDMNKFETIKEITTYYMDLLKTLEPKGKYDLVGYFDGALVVPKLLQKGLINKSVIIDIIDDMRVKEETLSDDFIVKFIFGFLSKNLPDSFKDKVNREINSEPDLNSKIRRIVSETKDFVGRGLIATDMEEIFKIAVKRVKIISKYMNEKRKKHLNQLKVVIGKKWAKKTGKIKFIKPFQFAKVDDPDAQIEETRDLYFLPQENESMGVVSIEGLDFENSFEITSESIGNKILAEFK